jgi:signal transduction histidine kinase
MSPISPSHDLLSLLARATAVLHDGGREVRERVYALFDLLHGTFSFHDARLTWWERTEANHTNHTTYHYVASDPDAPPWNNRRTRRVAIAGKMVTDSPGEHNEHNADDANEAQQTTHTAYLGAPIVWNNHLWGILELRADHLDAFSPSFRHVITALLPQLAAALHTDVGSAGELAGQGAKQAQEGGNGLANIPDFFEDLLSLSRLLAQFLRRAREQTQAEVGAVCLVDHERGELVLQTAQGYDFSPPTHYGLARSRTQERWSWETGLAGKAAREGRSLLVRDVSHAQERYPITANITAELAVPIEFRGKTLGVLVLGSPRSTAFGEQELHDTNHLCANVAAAFNRALAYQETLELKTHLSQVFTNMPTGLALLDLNGRVLRANPAWKHTWGLPRTKTNAANGLFHVPIDLVDSLITRFQEPMRFVQACSSMQETPTEVQVISVRLIEPVQDLQILSIPTRDGQGEINGRLWVVNDITREREIDRMKSEFISVVSHELRSPLTSILGYTELLLVREFPPQEQQQFIQTVHDQAERLSGLVEDLLSASRLESGKITLNQWIVPVKQVINSLTTQIGNLERHRLLLHVEEDLPPLYIDRDKVKQVLINLVTNAIKYSPQGGEIEVTVDLPQSGDSAGEAGGTRLPPDHLPGSWMVFSVRDYGIGIASEDLDLIWERFFRVDNTSTRQIGGTGLGLSITRSLVELHGGSIWVESTLGEGSTFFFTLPVATEQMLEEDDDESVDE